MIASTWYCIAQTSTFDTGCTINVAFDGYDIQFSASVKFGMSAINITRCNIPYDTVFSLRLREGASQWFVDIFCNKEITPNVTIADSPYWAEVSTTAGEGNVILVLNDISSKYNTEQGGGTGGLDIDQLKSYLDDNGYTEAKNFWSKEGDETIRTRHNIVVEKGGAFGRGSETNITFGRLDSWEDWDASTMMFYTLSASLGVNLNERLKYIEQNGSGLNEDDLRQYLTSNNYLQEADIADLRVTVKGLDDILNGGTKDVIDTWNEVVAFLDGYSQSDDLAAILSGMNEDISNRVLTTDFEKANDSIKDLLSYFDATGNANNALKLGGHSADHFATASSVSTLGTELGTLSSNLSAAQTNITTLQGYFTNGKANSAIKDKNGNDIVDTYATKSAAKTISDNLANVTERVNVAEDALKTYGDSIAKNAADIAANTKAIGVNETAILNLGKRVDKLEGYWDIDNDGNLHTTHNIVVEGGGAFGKGSGGGGDVPSASVSIKFEGSDVLYNPTNGVITLPAYPSAGGGVADSVAWSNITGKPNFATVATSGKYSDLSGTPTIPTSLKSPYALTFGSKTYDGSAAKTITASDLGALTAHQTIYALTINNSAGTAQVTYTPNSKAASLTLTKSMVGLSNVENTALSTWVGSVKITTLGTITSGTWNGTKIANGYLANSSMTIAGTSVSLGGSITAATLKTNLGLGSLAYKSSLVASDIPSLNWSKITSGKPTTAAGYGIVDALTFTNNGTYVGASMPSSDLSKLAASAYVELWDSAGWWNLKAAKYIVAGGTSSQFLKGDGSLDGTSYLPLSGGTITGIGSGILTINRTSGNPLIHFQANGTSVGYIGIDTDSSPCYVDPVNFGKYVFIHSGNIGDYALKTNGSNAMSAAAYIKWNTAEGSENYSVYGNGFRMLTYNVSTGDYRGGISIGTRYGWQLVRDGYTGTLQARFRVVDTTTWEDWKTIAFTDSNVASATKLQTARTIWGNSFDGTGNVSGVITMPANHQIQWVDSNAMIYGNGSNISISCSGKLNVMTTGNVLIGTTTDSGYKLDVDGTSRAKLYYAKGLNTYGSSWNTGAGGLNVTVPNDSGQTPLVVGYRTGTSPATAGVDRLFALELLDTGTQLRYSWGGAAKHVFYNNGNVEFTGNLTVTGGGAFGSDIRYKDIISYRQIDLETIVKAPLFSFRWNDREDKVEHLGTSAQYWLDTQFKDAVNITNPKFYHLDYGALAVGIGISVARETIKVKSRVEILENEVRQLKQELAQYRRA